MSQSTNGLDLVEALLLERTRQELINKSQSADTVKTYGATRWDRRNSVKPFATAEVYNRIDFNALFKGNLLNVVLAIHGDRSLGSTDDYSVEVLFEGVCDKLKQELQRNNYRLEYKIVYRAIVNAINSGDVLVSCTCPDWKYRQSYQSTMGRYNAGRPELRPANITNPNDTKGAGCKHVLNVLGNLDWAMNLATSITNYCFYIKDHYPDLFAQVIWPAISGIEYKEAEDDGYFDDLASTVGTINSEGQYDEVDTTEVDDAINYYSLSDTGEEIDSEGETNGTEL